MQRSVVQFLKSEDGAVTIDWVVITAGIVGLGILVVGSVKGGLLDTNVEIGQFLSDVTVGPAPPP